MSAPYYNDLDLPIPAHYLLPILFPIRKKKYTAYLINKDGSFNNKITENDGVKVLRNPNDYPIKTQDSKY